MIEYFTQLFSSPSAILGLVASVIVLVSMCFNTRTRCGDLWMRALNVIGSLLSVVYGLLLGPAGFGILLLNTPLVFISAYYVIKSWRSDTNVK